MESGWCARRSSVSRNIQSFTLMVHHSQSVLSCNYWFSSGKSPDLQISPWTIRPPRLVSPQHPAAGAELRQGWSLIKQWQVQTSKSDVFNEPRVQDEPPTCPKRFLGLPTPCAFHDKGPRPTTGTVTSCVCRDCPH